MKAGKRLGMVAFAAGLMLGTPLLAQSTQTVQQTTTQSNPAPPTTAPPSRTVGPQQLQNFSIGGTVTRPSDTQTAPAQNNAPPPTANPPAPAGGQAAPVVESSGAPRASRTRPVPVRALPLQPAPTTTQAPSPASPHFAPQSTAPSLSVQTTPAPASSAPTSQPITAPVPPPTGRPILPWLLAAAALLAGGGFLWWKRRSPEALAGGYPIEEYAQPEGPEPSPKPPPPAPPKFVAPEPVAPAVPASTGFVTTRLRPEPVPAPRQLPPEPPANPLGIVSTRLRPWLEVTVTPVACQVGDQEIVLEFDIDVLNSGGAPARDIWIESTLFNAGPDQDQALHRFMSQPGMSGDPIESISPLQRTKFRTSLRAQKPSIEMFDLGNRKLFVPVLAFNAIYRWSGGAGQTSGSYLLGRDTGAEKLAPLRADVGSKAYGGLGARPLETGVRR